MDAVFNRVKAATCLLVGTDAHFRAVAEAAARREFPGGVVTTPLTLKDALQSTMPPGLELLVLAHPNKTDLEHAGEAIDATGLPRWAIVVCGEGEANERVDFVPQEEWSEHLLGRVFRSALEQHQLRRANARLRGDLRTMAYRIMHDLRTPLGGILVTAESLKEALADCEPSNAALAKPLFDSVDDMKSLIERVSMLAKASLNPISRAPVAMGEVVFRVLQGLERQILRQGAIIAQPADWPEVEGMAPWLETIWSNLLLNALQHGNDGARIELGWSQAGGEYRFWVLSRHGRVPPEKLPKLFQPFHLLHQPNATRGLGLSIVQRLVELQGGNCGREFLAEDGSVFFFTLPAANRPAAPGSGSTTQNAVCESSATPRRPT
jgi:signal transduction histidine kinase